MLELGQESRNYHEELGRYAATQRIDIIYTLGEYADAIASGARSRGDWVSHVRSFQDHQSLISELHAILRSQDAVLVKGSRGMRMEKIVEGIVDEKTDLRRTSAA
jgi:UDP-N-acetylmuramoyl-tripeptide--D-alanyl-D-alanine ligase